MKKTVSVILTTCLLLGTISFSALANGRSDAPRMFKGPNRARRHEQRQPAVKRTPEQEKQLLKIRQAFETETQPLRFQRQKLQLELRQLWAAKQLDQKAIETKSQAVAALKVQLTEKTEKMQEQINKVLTAEQLKEYSKPAFRKGPKGQRKGPQLRRPQGRRDAMPGLTWQQQQQLLERRQAFQKETQPLRHTLQQKELELRLLWETRPLNQEKIAAQTKEVTALRVKLADKSKKLQEAMEKVLTKEQLEKLRSKSPQAGRDCGRCFQGKVKPCVKR